MCAGGLTSKTAFKSGMTLRAQLSRVRDKFSAAKTFSQKSSSPELIGWKQNTKIGGRNPNPNHRVKNPTKTLAALWEVTTYSTSSSVIYYIVRVGSRGAGLWG